MAAGCRRSLVFAALLAGCAAARGSGVELRGNRALDDDALRDGLALSRPRPARSGVDPYELSLDAQRLRSAYERRGYFQVEVQASVLPQDHTAVFTIVEGARARLAKITWVGLPADPRLSAPALAAAAGLREGEPFDYDRYDEAKAVVIATLEDAGYAHARIAPRVIADRARGEAEIQFAIEPGPRCVFGAIELRGVTGPLADAVRARLEVSAGGPYSPRALVASQDAIRELGRFTSVRVEAVRAAGAEIVPVTVSVTEAERHEARVGLGVGVDELTYLLRGSAGYVVAGWPSPLTSVDLSVTPAIATPHDFGRPELRLEAQGTLTRTDLFRPRLTGELSVAARYLTVEAYTSVGPWLRAAISAPLGDRHLQLRAGWRLSSLELVNIDPSIDAATRARIGLDRAERVAALEQRLALDLRDQPLVPTRGIYAALALAEATAATGSSRAYLKVEPDLRGYLPLGPVVVAAHARAGALFGEPPPTELYFAGGASSHRGFPERQLSPTAGERAIVIGGKALIEAGLEVRAALARVRGWPIVVAAFLDGGDVTEELRAIDPGHLHWAAGGGLRVVTPIGSLRLDVAARLNRRGEGEPLAGSRVAYQLGFGEAF